MPREKSGLYYPNRIVRIVMQAMEEVMGSNGLNAVLHLAGLREYIGHLPPDNLNKEFDFADFTALQIALEEMYGLRGGRGLALRAGRVAFSDGLRSFGALAGVGDLAFQVLPLSAKLRLGLPALASIFTQFSDQVSNVHEENDHYIYTLERCPMCWRRRAGQPVCFMGQGLLQEGLRWVSGGRTFRVTMTTCMATGDDIGRYLIFKQPVD